MTSSRCCPPEPGSSSPSWFFSGLILLIACTAVQIHSALNIQDLFSIILFYAITCGFLFVGIVMSMMSVPKKNEIIEDIKNQEWLMPMRDLRSHYFWSKFFGFFVFLLLYAVNFIAVFHNWIDHFKILACSVSAVALIPTAFSFFFLIRQRRLVEFMANKTTHLNSSIKEEKDNKKMFVFVLIIVALFVSHETIWFMYEYLKDPKEMARILMWVDWGVFVLSQCLHSDQCSSIYSCETAAYRECQHPLTIKQQDNQKENQKLISLVILGSGQDQSKKVKINQ